MLSSEAFLYPVLCPVQGKIFTKAGGIYVPRNLAGQGPVFVMVMSTVDPGPWPGRPGGHATKREGKGFPGRRGTGGLVEWGCVHPGPSGSWRASE